MDIKASLVKMRKQLEQLHKDLKDSAKPVDLNEAIGRLSRMDAMQQQQMSLHAKQQVAIELQQIEQALKRVEDGSYGYCLNCEEIISDKRLKARPHAPFCTKCTNGQ